MILKRKYNTFRRFLLTKPKFEHRKKVHYFLLAAVILLQIIVVLIWYIETKNDSMNTKSIANLDSSEKITKFTNSINNSYLTSQLNFNNYINNKDEVSLKKYSASLQEISSLIDSLRLVSHTNSDFKKILLQKKSVESDILVLKTSIDSIINNQIDPNQKNVLDLFKIKDFEFKKILSSVKTESKVKVDSVTKKGLFSRLGNAIAGKADIQKEQVNTIVTFQYKDKLTSGSIQEQIKNIFLTTNRYYKNEFNNLKNTFFALRNKDLELIKLNNGLLSLNQKILPNYYNSANLLQDINQKNLVDQYKTNAQVRNYSIVILIALMLIISIILLSLTRLEFESEEKLTLAQKQILQSLNFKNRIIGMISHEIRSPLNILSIYSKKVSTTVKDPAIKDTFKSIQFTTNSLLLLSNQILEFSKHENRKLKLTNKDFFLKPEIYQIITSMTSLVESKGNKLEINSNLNSDGEVCSDATRIHQLFYNIIGNANKFTENGLITITIKLENISDYEMDFQVEVIDTGSGIAEQDLKNIFESYYQGANSGKVKDLGFGLGLNLCKEIVELFEGQISVESEEGKGTKVKFNLILIKT
jgi:two-component system, NarL family, sensor histidine kinase BarA